MAIPPAPSAPPTSVRVSEGTSSSITVQWGPVDCADRNGDITGYSVRYGSETVSVSGDSSGGMYVISGLMPSTTYSIQVAAETSVWTGPYTAVMNQLTAGISIQEDLHVLLLLSVVAPVVTVESSAVTPTTIPVRWTSGGSEGLSYEVVWSYNGGCAGISGGSDSVSGDMTSYTVEGLEEYITYSITVRVTNSESSEASQPVSGMTTEAGEYTVNVPLLNW